MARGVTDSVGVALLFNTLVLKADLDPETSVVKIKLSDLPAKPMESLLCTRHPRGGMPGKVGQTQG